MHTPAPHMAGGSSTSSGSCTATWRRRTATNATSPATVVVLLAALVLSLQLQQVSALYHTSSEVLHWFSHWAAKRPDVLRFRELHERQTRTALPVATISHGINSSTHGKPTKPAVLFVFGEHAREVITPEVGVWLGRLLIDPNSTVYSWPELSAAFERAGVDASGRSLNSSTTSGSAGQSSTVIQEGGASSTTGKPARSAWPGIVRGWVREVLSALEVVIVPIEALDSRRLVEAGQLCVRKTASNVDLNRNWPFAWKKVPATDEQYGGPNPFSEPQSRLMRHLIDHLGGRLLGYVNVHSGEWALYTPWDSKEAYGPGLPSDLPDLVSKVGRLCECKAGPAGAVSGYLAYGTSMDYLYVHKRVPYPLTVEVYGGGNIGKLGPGEANKGLTAWPTVTKAGAPTTAAADFQRRRLLLQEQQQQQGGLAAAAAGSTGRGLLMNWARSLLQLLPGAQQLEQQQQQHEVDLGAEDEEWLQLQRQHRRSRRRRRNRLQQAARAFGGGGGGGAAGKLTLLPDTDVAAAAADGTTASGSAGLPGAAAGFSATAGGNLDQLKQQAKQQLLQQQPTSSSSVSGPSVLSLPSNTPLQAAVGDQQEQQQGGGAKPVDALLVARDAALVTQRGCFDAFNPYEEGEYRRVVADWLAASLLMLKHMLDGEEGQAMVRRLAVGGGGSGGGGSGGQHHSSGISIHRP